MNHPGIAAIYGTEEDTADGTRALVLELVEGPTLADRIAEGAMPIEDALPIAKQIAEALEAAHEAGVIHRDLKPANIKVREDGSVKVLDFGLAKAFDTTPQSDPSQSPTLTAAATQIGVIMGTAAYMSPEQARGKPADRRSDLWALGAVLFEMLSATRPFGGTDVSEVLAGVIKSEPDWTLLPGETPDRWRQVIRRCLEKDPRQRLRDAGDLRLAQPFGRRGGRVRVSSAGGLRPRWSRDGRSLYYLRERSLYATDVRLGATFEHDPAGSCCSRPIARSSSTTCCRTGSGRWSYSTRSNDFQRVQVLTNWQARLP